jgi:hypothetical protein
MNELPSQASSLGFTVAYHETVPLGGKYLGAFDSIASWHHTTQAFGGYDTAAFTVTDYPAVLEDWFENGIGRHIVAYDEDTQPFWEGFVDQVTLSIGGLQVTRGPLMNVGNFVELDFASFDFGYTPPIPGIKKSTGSAENQDSQERYGIIYKLLSATGINDANALQLRDTYLSENQEPTITSNFAFSSDDFQLSIECKGYLYWLNYPYNNVTVGFTNLSNKLKDVLGDDPNGIISSDYSDIETNVVQLPWWDIDDSIAKDVVKALVAMGDASNRRYVFGIYDDRKAFYAPAPTTINYTMALRDISRKVYDAAGNAVPPWRIRPGRWVKFTDFIPGFIARRDDLRLDPRNLFIESIEYTAPNLFNLTGGKTTKLEQKMARLGLSGIFA